MNAEQFKGKFLQFEGELRRQWGKFTDDDMRRIEGNLHKFVGIALERYGDKKDELMQWVDQWFEQSGNEHEMEPPAPAKVSKRRRSA
jgi:uncharacterized protein YjbJ (UPF0337 family)